MFLERGELSMRPLTLGEVAHSLDLHESTVSRACSSKYIMTPRGTYELKYLFPSRVKNESGKDHSSVSIKHKLQQVIEQEDKLNPLSDQQITNQLKENGIKVARRTVAKYRSSLFIPSRKKRKAIALSQLTK